MGAINLRSICLHTLYLHGSRHVAVVWEESFTVKAARKGLWVSISVVVVQTSLKSSVPSTYICLQALHV